MEVLRRYLNRSEMVGPVVDILRRIEAGDQTDKPGAQCTGPGGEPVPTRRQWDRGELAALVEKRRYTPLKVLAQEQGVSVSTIQRLLKKSTNQFGQ